MTTYLTTKDLQGLIRVDKSTIYRMAEDGRIPAIKVGRQWRFPQEAVRTWLGDGDGAASDPRLSALISSDVADALVEVVADALGVMTVLTDLDGTPISRVGNACGLFAALSADPAVLPRCVAAWGHYGATPDLVPRFTPSEFGFLCSRAFVRSGHLLLGMVIVGGLAPEVWPPTPETIAALAADLGVPPEQFREHADEVYRLGPGDQARVLEVLPKVAVLVSHLADQGGRVAGTLSAIVDLAAPERRSVS